MPTSRPEGSYHSCSVCAPPEVPPAPTAIAGMPNESGILASVEDRSMRARLPRYSSAACTAARSGELSANSPPGLSPSTFVSIDQTDTARDATFARSLYLLIDSVLDRPAEGRFQFEDFRLSFRTQIYFDYSFCRY